MADLSMISAPGTRGFDLFISHNTKDNSHTVYFTHGAKWHTPLGGHNCACVATSGYFRLPQGLHEIAERAWTFHVQSLCTRARTRGMPYTCQHHHAGFPGCQLLYERV